MFILLGMYAKREQIEELLVGSQAIRCFDPLSEQDRIDELTVQGWTYTTNWDDDGKTCLTEPEENARARHKAWKKARDKDKKR
jgi:hypothetical protein